jgi:hypothetical protein
MTAVLNVNSSTFPLRGTLFAPHTGHPYGSMSGTWRNLEFVRAVQTGRSDVPYLAGVPTPAEMIAWRVAERNTLSQAQVADLLGCSVERVQGFELGTIIPGGDGDQSYLYVYGTMAALINLIAS